MTSGTCSDLRPNRSGVQVMRGPEGWDVFAVHFATNQPPAWDRLAGPFATEQQADRFAATMQSRLGKEVT